MANKKKINLFIVAGQTIEVAVYVDTSKDTPRILSLEDEKKLEAKLPDTINKYTTKWAVPNYGLHTWIEHQAWIHLIDGKLEFDMLRHARARVQALLVDWSVVEEDPSKKLIRIDERMPDGTVVKLLNPSSMQMIAEAWPQLMDTFYEKAILALYPRNEKN